MKHHIARDLEHVVNSLLAIRDEIDDLVVVVNSNRSALTILAAAEGGTEQATMAPEPPALLGVGDAATVVALSVAPAVDDGEAGASTTCPFGTSWCPDKDGRVCADCSEFGEAA